MFDNFSGDGLGVLSAPVYSLYEATHAALGPSRAFSDATRAFFENPGNPFSKTPWAKSVVAACEVFERVTRRYGKPAFGIKDVLVGGERVAVHEEIVWQRPFCNLLHFSRAVRGARRPDPKLLIVAPMSGHYATLLRGTVAAFLPNHEVYITDWVDARMVPAAEGRFDLDDYIDYVISMLHTLGPDTHVVGVCQPSVPVMAAVSRMEAEQDPYIPQTMTLMGGPIDTRLSPTKVNDVAVDKGIDWFRSNVITKVPFPHPGFMRDVYPGFLQLSGFMTMNIDRHVNAHKSLYFDLVRGDGDNAQKHREFYDEYLSVMDLTAEFYLQTVETVFINFALAKGEMTHRGKPVDPAAIRNVALLTVEGENDDITGHGQTQAAHGLCVNLPPEKKAHYTQMGVGHYGVFNGSRFRSEIAPRIADFIRSNAAPSVVPRGGGAAKRPVSSDAERPKPRLVKE
ncbi:polyhydroxyalkanoate depolymerase [Labrys monachus]|uniref:Poly(3-hydroxybutyrate) depolymerase n=1 Tax=Labrys monachus TaxID=217067 RepID=A0ABU0FE04_9HYPH|nr:polyhydroxyalkanoate depolymerase [Labrys monachus]MDQ0392295.1 poly(3-hydroxybutyrate) depolymerase [Labrys monachus]